MATAELVLESAAVNRSPSERTVLPGPAAGEARGSALLLAADGGCGRPGRGDPARRQADEEAPCDVGRREECGVRADDRLLGRAQKESREVARLRRSGTCRTRPEVLPDEAPREVNRSPLIRPTAVCLRGSRTRRGSERCSSPPRGSPGVRPRHMIGLSDDSGDAARSCRRTRARDPHGSEYIAWRRHSAMATIGRRRSPYRGHEEQPGAQGSRGRSTRRRLQPPRPRHRWAVSPRPVAPSTWPCRATQRPFRHGLLWPTGANQGFGAVGGVTSRVSCVSRTNLMSSGLSPVTIPVQIARLPSSISTTYLRRRY